MSLSVQFVTMAAMGVMGIWIGISVDTYGRLFYRGGRQRWNMIQIAGDLLFWLIQGLLVFLVLLNVNDGDLRIYIFLAILCGYAAYRSLLQTLYRRVLERFIQAVRFLLYLLIQAVRLFILRPFQWLLKLLAFLGKITLSVFAFAIMIVWVPLKWIFRLVVPDQWVQKGKKFFSKAAGIWQNVKNLKNKIQSWLKRTDDD